MEVGPGLKRKRWYEGRLSWGGSETISSRWTWRFIEREWAEGESLGKRGKKKEAG